ncbi:MAG TPA: ATP phosphoribosyltransferase [Anaerolineales bacterium]|nr:ATP phosphoribosyltransferase [Anaerolineales bacterium]
MRTDIRLALPSKGRLEPEALDFLDRCGLRLYKPNPRQYQAAVPAIPALTVLFQRPGDIVVGVRTGSIDFGLAGLDVIEEKRGPDGDILILHDELGFGACSLVLAAPEGWGAADLAATVRYATAEIRRPLRVATKYHTLTERFLREHNFPEFKLIDAEGTLEIAPAVGYADLIADLVSSGQTLRDNRLVPLSDGVILRSQACLIANRNALQSRPEILAVARELLEYIEAHLRAERFYMVTANMRGSSPDAISQAMFTQPDLRGLQGPTIAPVVPHTEREITWHAVNIIVRKDRITQAVQQLRAIGGSGVIVSPVTYIFEEEPERYRAMLEAMRNT